MDLIGIMIPLIISFAMKFDTKHVLNLMNEFY